jgi:hypothetical protein
LPDEIVQIMIRLQDHITAAPAIAAARTAFGTIFLTRKRHASLATVSGAGVDFDFVDKHCQKPKRKSGKKGNRESQKFLPSCFPYKSLCENEKGEAKRPRLESSSKN